MITERDSEDSRPPSVWTPYCSFGQRDKASRTPTYSFTPHHHTNWTTASGRATLVFTTHLHPPVATIPTGNIISLHILCIQHNGVGECAVWRWGYGQAQMFPSMRLWQWQVCCKKNVKEKTPQGSTVNGSKFTLGDRRQMFISQCFVSTLEKSFCNFYSAEGQSFPQSSAWNFSVHLAVCIHISMCTVGHAESEIKRYAERKTEKWDQNVMKIDTNGCGPNVVKKCLPPFPDNFSGLRWGTFVWALIEHTAVACCPFSISVSCSYQEPARWYSRLIRLIDVRSRTWMLFCFLNLSSS